MSKGKRIFIAIFMLAILVYLYLNLSEIDVVYHTEIEDFEIMTRQMNVKNMVTAIYLGPRIFDTFLEVMVVILTVFGMKFIRSKE